MLLSICVIYFAACLLLSCSPSIIGWFPSFLEEALCNIAGDYLITLTSSCLSPICLSGSEPSLQHNIETAKRPLLPSVASIIFAVLSLFQ